jgi:hypothetical protein
MTFNEQLFRLRLEYHRKRTPAAMATGYFDNGMKVKKPKSAAQMESLIREFITLSGYHCQKVTTMGVRRGNTWTRGTATRGAADLMAIVGGRAIQIEVKFSKGDRQSDEQAKFEESVKRAGGEYYIVRTLDEFIAIWEMIVKNI